VIRGLLRILTFLFVARIVLRFLAAVVRGYEAKPPSRPGRADGAVELLRDRICNTFFPAPRAVRATIAGEEQAFCSAECAQRARVLASS
jgi:hypothetical protein